MNVGSVLESRQSENRLSVCKKKLVFDNWCAFFASVLSTWHTIDTVIPLNTSFSWTCLGTCRYVEVTYTLNTLVSVYVVDLLTCWVIVFINNRFYRTFVDTSSTVDTSISNNYCHFVSPLLRCPNYNKTYLNYSLIISLKKTESPLPCPFFPM